MTATAETVASRARSASWWIRVTTISFVGLVGVLFLLSLLVAIVLPYGEWDAMALGIWSREMAVHWPTVHFSDVYFANYNRPLFFVTQGFLWHFFGFHPQLGRVWSLSFAVLLAGGISYLAWKTARAHQGLAAATAALLLYLILDFDVHVASGLTDIPVAAFIALTAGLLLTSRLGRAQPVAVCLSATLAVLSKPSAFPALAGLCIALALGERAGLVDRGKRLILPVVGGVVLGIAYDFDQAHRLHMGLWSFVSGYTGGQGSAYYAHLASQIRTGVFLSGGWLGTQLRLLLLFALAYAVIRLITPRHRLAVAVAFPIAILCALGGPRLGATLDPAAHVASSGGGGTARIALLIFDAALLLSFAAPANAIPTRLTLARLLAWIVPTFALWIQGYPFETRSLAPAWPPMVVLMVLVLIPVFAGALSLRRSTIVVPALPLLIVGALSAYNINGLGSSRWQQLQAGGIAGLGNAARMRRIGLGGDFAAELNALAPQVQPHDRIATIDSRLRFFYLDQFDYVQPRSCSQLPHDRIFVQLEDDEVRALYGDRAGSSYWEACKGVHLTKIDERPGAYVIFVRGAPAPSVGGCGIESQAQNGFAVEFGRFQTAAAAQERLTAVKSVGFVQAKVEQLGCALYRVDEDGIPTESVARSIVAEARPAHLTATIVHP